MQSQKSAILEMKQRLKRAEAPFVEVNADTGELGVSRRSLLGRTLQELCRTPGADDSDPAVASEEIRTLLRVCFPRRCVWVLAGACGSWCRCCLCCTTAFIEQWCEVCGPGMPASQVLAAPIMHG